MERIVAGLKVWAPYLALELVMPGGTVMALLLYLHRRRSHFFFSRSFKLAKGE